MLLSRDHSALTIWAIDISELVHIVNTHDHVFDRLFDLCGNNCIFGESGRTFGGGERRMYLWGN
jgi:hypothetical protein